MAVTLYIRPVGAPPEAGRLVPIATQDVFRRYWLPASQALSLVWVPLFETGLPLPSEDCPDVLAELRRLKAWIEAHQPEAAEIILARVEHLISELELRCADPRVRLYIG